MFLFWSWWFAMSKVAEFGDTIFIVLRKRPLTFLHVFHHCTVLIASWYVALQVAPAARWFVTINYSIHAIMYTYFALQILRWFRIPRWISMSITIMQVKLAGAFLSLMVPMSHAKPCFFVHRLHRW